MNCTQHLDEIIRVVDKMTRDNERQLEEGRKILEAARRHNGPDYTRPEARIAYCEFEDMR